MLGRAENILFPFMLAQLSVAKYFLPNGDGSAECSRISVAKYFLPNGDGSAECSRIFADQD